MMFFSSSPCLLVFLSVSAVSPWLLVFVQRKAPLGIDSDPAERREFDLASTTGGLSILPETGDRPAASREVIADGE